ncbi:MAG TPA: ribosome assembly RNA-binding protein YhbY [Blastocatellia bacterium]|jgi:RNA-binding protein|nr:ribosome assembly RNA-binding protein YhbY [Blastocatellia bacterium]
MEKLNARQRAHLRALAHPLKPILHIGKEGVTDLVVDTIERAFNTRELLKLKVLEPAPEEARETADILAGRIEGAHAVQVIGRTVVLYRRHPERPKIEFPR